MAVDIEGIAREILTSALQGGGGSSNGNSDASSSNGGHSRVKGLVAGAGAAALAPAAVKAARQLATGLGVENLEDFVTSPGEAIGQAKSKLTERITEGAKGKAKDAVDDAGGPGGIMKDAVKGMLPFGGGGGSKGGAEGVGKGRRMPIQQSIDIGLPIETVYNQWTQFEEWPSFMHRVTRVTQEDDCTVSFATKVWGKTKEFTADIQTQRPEQRIKWRVSQGMTHTGVVSFHELGPNLTRVLVSFDVDPGSMVEKFARGARHIKRAARADLHRFKALIETAEHETGAWRGVIEDGEVVEEHDPSYDEEREYSDIGDLTDGQDSDDEDDADDEDNADADDGQESRRDAKRSQGRQQSRRSSTKKQSSGRGASKSQSGRKRRQPQSSGSSSKRTGGQSSGAKSRKSSRAQPRKRSAGRAQGRRG
jgi:uncharacterized membrane protein